jgi:hypothetical protein
VNGEARGGAHGRCASRDVVPAHDPQRVTLRCGERSVSAAARSAGGWIP